MTPSDATVQPQGPFEIFGLNPGSFPPQLALALARGGATGVLDLVHAGPADSARLHFGDLARHTEARIGLRIGAAQLPQALELLAQTQERRLTVFLAAEATAVQQGCVAQLRAAHAGLTVWAEVTGADAAAALGDTVDGLIALGHEAGGWVGEDTSFILLQKLHGVSSLPVIVRGGIGIRAAAACRVAGAHGVVLDDCLLLLRESPLPAAQQNELARLNGAECKLFGERVDQPLRVYGKPSSPALKAADADDRAAEGGQLPVAEWRQRMEARVAWSGDADYLLPIGQAIGLAAGYRQRHGSVAKLLQALRRASQQQIESAAGQGFLDEGGPLAGSHGTRFPVVQGPMTRVSDVPGFAVDVARGGALPLLALALMRGPQVRDMLEQTRDRIGDAPWGVGLLGFVPHALREEQCAEIWKCPPPFALIAGGRPDQAAEFEKRGITTYIHAPAPALLRMYLEQGARRFVFEGRECGGHVGPISSFPLWEQMIELLLAEVAPADAKDVHVLFAGGIHDALSCAMVAAMTAPLAARGMKVGVLMGTAYLFTREIVHSGAIVQGFQDEALRCRRTVNLETGPGHASRCVDTQFAREFFDTRRRLIREGRSAEEIRDELEDLNLGRLRIASKGVNRNAEGKMVAVATAEQLDQGMYMIGQVATLRDAPVAVEELHLDVCRGAQVHLKAWAEARATRRQQAQPADIAIVGIGTLLPKADGPDAFWHNILNQHRAIGPVPPERWDPELYFDADRKTRDKIYARWGGFLDEVPFDPMKFGIPPRSMKSIDPMQLLTLEVAQRTLADAGYGEGGFDRENTSIILGAGGGLGDLGLQYGVRAELPRFVENPDPRVWDRLPEWTEESFAGTLLNVAAGRVANRMDFGGLNFTVDAACASSLAAISIAVGELESGRSNFALAGGIDTVQSPFGFLCFSKTQALSPTGAPRTFDQAADGIAISEGLAVVALKRLADAERDGDRVYAVIKAVSGSSDGKALGLTAPRPDGQIRALKRAYAKAGFSPASLELFEAHGTGTPVGDKAEAETITRALRAEGADANSVALGSVKTLVGHTKASAGVAGLIKMALSLYHRVQPAHYGVDKPIDILAASDSPAYLLKQPRPWVASPDHPRRAGVSAFGFGGTNFHAVLEEYAGAQGATAGQDRWPHELIVFRAADTAQLQQQIAQLQPVLGAPGTLRLAELALALARAADSRGAAPVRLALVASDFAALAADLDKVIAHLRNGQALPPHLKLNTGTPAEAPKVAFVFPGQGAQYVNMGRETALFIDEIRQSLEHADRSLKGQFPRRLSQYILPPAAFDAETEAAQQAALTDTRVAQPAIGAVSLGYLALAERLGLQASATAGHSYGEYVALAAAGAISRDDCLKLSAIRGAAMAQASASAAPGTMAAVQGTREAIESAIQGFAGVRIANHNAPQQSVISGPRTAVESAVKALGDAGMRSTLLPVSGAFHTELVADARPPLSAAITQTQFQPARVPVYSNRDGQPYPADPAQMQGQLDGHLLSSVEFVREIKAMAASGCAVFVELGPKSICTHMVRAIVSDTPAVAVSLDGQGGGIKGLLSGLSELWTQGVTLNPVRLFDGRELRLLDVAQLAQAAVPDAIPAHAWMISGGCARAPGETERRTGRLPALTLATARAARAEAEAEAKTRNALTSSAVAPTPTAPAPVAASAAAIPGGLIGAEAMLAYQQTMQQFLALQERVMQQALGGAAPTGAIPAPQAPPSRPPPAVAAPAIPEVSAAPAPQPRPSIDVVAPAPAPALAPALPVASVDFKATLLELVADRTGYPQDMLALDADLEADLGIDSIKRVEIIGALQKALPADMAAQINQAMERFTQARSLASIVDALTALQAPTDTVAPKIPVAAAPTVSLAAAPATVPRYVVRATAAPLPSRRVRITGTALIFAAPDTIADALIARLRAEGLQPLAVNESDAEGLTTAVHAAQRLHGPIRAVLHLSGLDAGMGDDAADWQAGSERHLLSMLHLAQALGNDLAEIRLLAASRLGGSFGRASVGDGPLLAGGLNGMLNCLRHEYPAAVMRAVDFNGQSDGEMVAALCDELLSDDTAPEIGYVGRERYAARVVEQAVNQTVDQAHTALTPDADWVVLATGGARGITAELLEEMAVPGMRLVLLGRSAEPESEPAALAGLHTVAQLRAHLLDQARARGVAAKPAEIDRGIARIQADREIRANLARLRAAGCQVDYQPCDVRDETALNALLAGLYERHGRIDAVIHGAGVIEDKLITDKQADSFRRVLGTKLDAARVFARTLQPASLKLLCFFTSVAGRFGNRGQSDYAAANETLNRLAWQLHRRWPDTRVMAINWGPWDAGMASEAVKAAFRAQGIEPIPVAAGRRYFREELRSGACDDVELVVGRGTWSAAATPPAAASAGGDSTPHLTLITHAPRMGPGGAMTLDHRFTADSDPYLLDHRIDGKLVLPAAGAAEWMAQFAAAAWPGWQVSELRDLRQFNGISLEADGERLIQLRARASSHSDAGTQSITVEMVDPAQKRPCYRATVCLVERLADAPVINLAAVTDAQPVNVDDAYGHYLFHGPRFQLIKRIDGVSLQGVDAAVQGANVQRWLDRDGRWLFDPGLLDLPPQLAIVWSRVHHDMTALPSAFGRVTRYAGGDRSGPLKLAMRMLPDDQPQSVRYDAWITDAQGRVLVAMERCEGHMSAALNRLADKAKPGV